VSDEPTPGRDRSSTSRGRRSALSSSSSARLGIVVARDPGPERRQVGTAVAIAAVTAGVTLAAGALPGPPGVIAPAVATLGCVVLAVALRAPDTVTSTAHPRRRRPR